MSIASRTRGINADEALLTGLIHNVGKIYIFARACKHADLSADTTAMGMIRRDCVEELSALRSALGT